MFSNGTSQKYGSQICISGGFNSNGRPARPEATDEEVRTEVWRCMDEYGKYRGYMFFGFRLTKSLDPQVNLAALMPMLQEAESYRKGIKLDGLFLENGQKGRVYFPLQSWKNIVITGTA